MTEQELKKEVRWMKRVTKDPDKTDDTVEYRWHPKFQRFIKGLMELGVQAEMHDSLEEWRNACELCGNWNKKYPTEIYMTEAYMDDETGGSIAHIEDETFRFTE